MGALRRFAAEAKGEDEGVSRLSDQGHTGSAQSVWALVMTGCRSFFMYGGVPMTSHHGSATHQLCFASLFHQGSSVFIPCDTRGEVDLDSLSERLKNAYLGARALVGWEFDSPTVEEVH
jgi:hypothetical protein